MEGSALQRKLIEMQMQRVRDDMFPSVEMMNRVEAALETREELEEYAALLLKRIESTRWPSLAMINRVEGVIARLGTGSSPVAAQAD